MNWVCASPIEPIIRSGAFREERTSDEKRVDRFFMNR
jgi:hypothetical protein